MTALLRGACAVLTLTCALAAPAQTAREAPADAELYATLLSWAVTLSGAAAPARPPRVLRVSHAFLVEQACGGRECKVLGWFRPGEAIYLDERLDPLNNLLAASIVVHEMVHYLQYLSMRGTPDYSCAQALDLERRAYGVQRDFIAAYGVYHPVGASLHQVGCEPPEDARD